MAYTPPSVSNETAVETGRTWAVEDYRALEPKLGVKIFTGNGDDGIGVTDWWIDAIYPTVKINIAGQFSGEKVSSEAQLLGLDATGTPLDSSGSLLASDAYVINPDLFNDANANIPDQIFEIGTGAEAAHTVYQVLALAPPPDQTFVVDRGPKPPTQIFNVLAITKHDVATAEIPFIVTVFAKPADQTHSVLIGPDVPHQIFSVIRGPDNPDSTFDVKVLTEFDVTVAVAPADVVYTVTTGPNPPATPNQIFGVSIGGSGAPPIPTPDQTFNVLIGPDIPDQTFSVVLVDQSFTVTTAETPYVVSVGPNAPDQTFVVTTLAPPAQTTYIVAVGPDAPDATFEFTVVETLDVMVYDAAQTYGVTAPGSGAYSFNGEGLTAVSNPSLSATVGQTMNFNVTAYGHPFWVCSSATTGGCASAATPSWAMQLDNNGTQSGTVRVRFASAGTYYYNCEYHSSMRGTITVT